MRSGAWLTDALLVVMALVWGVNFAVVKFGATAIAPVAFNGARMLIASIVLAAIATLIPGKWPSRRDTISLLLLGLLGNGLYQWFFVEGIARVRAGSASLVLAAVPAMVAILGWLRGTDRITRSGVAGIALSMAGVGVIVYGGQRTGGGASTLVGAGLVFTGAACWSLYTVLLKPFADRLDGLWLHAITMWSGTALLGAVAIPAMARTEWTSMSALEWGAIAYSALGALVIAYVIWYRGVKHLGPTRTAMYANIQPAIALLVAWPLLAEVPSVWQLSGAVLVLAGVVLVRRSPVVMDRQIPATTPIVGEPAR